LVSQAEGLVLEREGADYRVQLDRRECRAILRGKVKRTTPKVVAGDRVLLEPELAGELWAIVSVLPRRNVLERRVPLGRGTRPVVANIDRVFVMTATRDPAPIPSVIDRLLVLAEANDIPAALLLNKIDLDPGRALAARYRASGYEVLPISARSGAGLDGVRNWLPGHATVLTGPSGSGKSSLLNALEPGLGLRTGAVSDKGRRGTQTTVSARMVSLQQGGWLVDTPGFSEVGLWGLEPRGLAQCFPELRPMLGACKYGDCRHVDEPGCAIRAAVTRGAISLERYESYRLLLAETEAEPAEWE
jgi:ribosome biogenesis GTPase